MPIFSQNGQLLIFRPKLGEIVQLRTIFWFKYCRGCCRELSGGGWSWVEVEMSWVKVGARFSNTRSYGMLYSDTKFRSAKFSQSSYTQFVAQKNPYAIKGLVSMSSIS